MTPHGSLDTRRRVVLWMGDHDTTEIRLARDAVAAIPRCVLVAPTAADSLPSPRPDDGVGVVADLHPDVVVLAVDRPGRWSAASALAVSRRWPLVPLLAVTSSLADGRRRSGPPLPGVEEIAWHDAAGRLARWFFDLDAGVAGSLGQPPTARREDRILEAPSFQPRSLTSQRLPAVAVAARRPLELDGLCELLFAVGHPVEQRCIGRPNLAPSAGLVVWDACRLDTTDLEWLRMLVANQPDTAVVILESFPRGDSALAALQAGAAAVLGRPVGLEALGGTLAGLAPRLAVA